MSVQWPSWEGRIVALEADLARAERDNARLVAALVAVRDASIYPHRKGCDDGEWYHQADDITTPLAAIQDLLPSPLDGDGLQVVDSALDRPCTDYKGRGNLCTVCGLGIQHHDSITVRGSLPHARPSA